MTMLAQLIQRSTCAVPHHNRHSTFIQQQVKPRNVARRSGSTSEAVTDEEAQRFEKIAAALVEKLKDLPDYEDEPLGESNYAAARDMPVSAFDCKPSAVLLPLLLLVLVLLATFSSLHKAWLQPYAQHIKVFLVCHS